MIRLFLIPYILTIESLIHALPAHGRVCQEVFVSPQIHRNLQVPHSHLIGDASARQAVQAQIQSADQRLLFQSIRLEGDPAFRGSVLQSFSDLTETQFGVSKRLQIEIEQQLGFLENTLKHHKSDQPLFLMTSDQLGLRAFNRLFSQRIYPVRNTLRDSTMFENISNGPETFLSDLERARLNELLIHSSQSGITKNKSNISSRFYRTFDYQTLTSRLSNDERILFDVAYYLYFYEWIGSINWGQRLAQALDSNGRLTTQDLQRIYSESYLSEFVFSFMQNTKLQVTLTTENGQTLIDRFLDQTDLWIHLPTSIKNQVQRFPQERDLIIRQFLNDAFTIYFNLHFEIARQITLRES